MISPRAFLTRFGRALDQVESLGRRISRLSQTVDRLQQSIGRMEARQLPAAPVRDFSEVEFQVFSQWGEDGIIQYLVRHVPIARPVFVEFGVENYTEANTRFLLLQNHWSGLIIDGSADNIRSVKKEALYWRHNLKAVEAFVTRENINALLADNGLDGEIGLLSVDVDGNDYWIWEAVTTVNPAIVIVEYNHRFGGKRAVTIPYDAGFMRTKAHPSNIYYGASLGAFCHLARKKGYDFVGCNSAGNNAFFVRSDLRPAVIPELSPEEGFRSAQFREARAADGRLLFLSPAEESRILADLPVVEIAS